MYYTKILYSGTGRIQNLLYNLLRTLYFYGNGKSVTDFRSHTYEKLQATQNMRFMDLRSISNVCVISIGSPRTDILQE